MLDIWKWWIPSFPTGCWITFPSHPLEIREVQENGHFRISKPISMEIEAGPKRLRPHQAAFRRITSGSS